MIKKTLKLSLVGKTNAGKSTFLNIIGLLVVTISGKNGVK